MKNSACHNPYLKYFLLLNILLGFMLTKCAPLPKTSPAIPSKATSQPAGTQVTITGWFATIWNDEPHYSITDDKGQTTQLLLEDEIAKPLGGPLELDRKRVTIIGEITSEFPETIRVLSVQFENTK
jgi:hypothetical protein